MKEIEFEIQNRALKEEIDFYSNYKWSLNPILSLTDLFFHMEEELERFDSLEIEWQREESRINLYLFACAIACTIDDYIGWAPINLHPLIKRYPKFQVLINISQALINIPYRIKSLSKIGSVIKFREAWEECLNKACNILLRNNNDLFELKFIYGKITVHKEINLPVVLLKRRMKINEGFRCQDLTHHDIIKLADKYLFYNTDLKDKIVIIGPRTAGAYFAPLIRNYFEMLGWSNVDCLTIRPKTGLSKRERSRMKSLLNDKVKVILTDDYTNTGNSFKQLQDTVKSFGIKSEQITILAPIHPLKSYVNPASDERTKVIKLNHPDLYKQNLFGSTFIKDLFNEYYSPDEWNLLITGLNPLEKKDYNRKSSGDDDSLLKLNSQLFDNIKEGFQVRLKHLYKIQLQSKSGELIYMKVIGKSVGWGWLGYHAFHAGTSLHEFVPEIIGLRNGILFEKWIDGKQTHNLEVDEYFKERITEYIIEREQKLKLNEDPKFYSPETGWGWLEILEMLRRPFGVRTGRIMNKTLLKYLDKAYPKNPVLVDGKLQSNEWIELNNSFIKIDFEHHNFGAPNFDIVDPAYDIAGACFEFNLSKEDEEKFLNTYINRTGDTSIIDRFILYKLLYALLINKKVHEEIYEKRYGEYKEEYNQRFIRSWSSLIYSMNSFCGNLLINKVSSYGINCRLFFLDFDGVLDSEVFGFQHTTFNGLYSIALLNANRFSIIPNTGRSIEHVKNYCNHYNFEAGIAEYGSVIVTDNNKTEIPLIDTETIRQLSICRKILKDLPDVFIDPNYKFSIRAYKFSSTSTKGLDKKEADEILRIFKLDRLRIISRQDDTYIVGKNINKGNALLKLRNYLHRSDKPTYAMGDSEEDISMLETADYSFAPANCAEEIRLSSARDKIKIMKSKYQNGLLEAVKVICKKDSNIRTNNLINFGKENSVCRLLIMLLMIADQSKLRKSIYLIRRKLVKMKNPVLHPDSSFL